MFKLWGKIVKKNNLVQSHVLEMTQDNLSVEEMISKGIEDLCNLFDIANPMWMRDNSLEMDQINKTRFRSQHFIEENDFDYFEIEYIVERV
ncbi:MAG: hypothetical protein IBX70_08830 [Clostridia bacterium]|nr:hypothetical protein [Clostridia bacterium]